MTKWIFGWKRKNWTNSSNKPVINKISLMALDKVIPLMDAVDWVILFFFSFNYQRVYKFLYVVVFGNRSSWFVYQKYDRNNKFWINLKYWFFSWKRIFFLLVTGYLYVLYFIYFRIIINWRLKNEANFHK